MAKKKSNATRRVLWIIGSLLVLVVILGVVGSMTGLFGSGAKGVEVETADASIRSITQVVTASGKVQPETEVVISPDVSGEIIDLPVKEGDQVARGTLLARIKPDFYLTQVEQADAGVLQAKAGQAQRRADLLQAEAELKRKEELFKKNAVSASELELAKTARDIAQAALEGAEYAVRSADARLSEAREQVHKTAIYAPMSGTISKLDVELGERVVGTSQMAGTEMMRVARLDQMEVEVEVNENEIVNVALGDTASIDVDAYPERPFKGIVTEIANSARTLGAGTQEQVTNFPVKVRILNDQAIAAAGADQVISQSEVPVPANGSFIFRPGMSATVDIFTETVMNIVGVPIQAVTVRDFNKVRKKDEAAADSVEAKSDEEDLRKVVFIVAEGKAEMVEVETGISDDTYIEVRSGLTGGEKVVTGPYRAVSRTLEPADAVKIEDEEKKPGVTTASGS